jgi:hypothetical protein
MTRNSRWLVALPFVSALALVACTAKPPSAAKIEHAQVDNDARKVTLTSDAAKHLSIKTDAVREEAVVRTRVVGGEVVALPASALAAPPAPVVSPSSAPDQFPIVLDERFELNTRGWPDDLSSTAWLDRDGLGYRLSPIQPGQFTAIGAPGQADLRDAFVSATFRKTAGASGGGYGLIIRDQQPATRDGLDQGGSYYVFEVSDRGEYGVWRRDGDQWVDLVRWTTSDVVRPGVAENTLAVAAVGDTMTFLVNGTALTAQTDSTLSSGGVGIFAGGDGDHFLVDRLVVRAPAPEPPAAAPQAVEGTRLAVRVPLAPSDQNQVVRGQAVKVLPLQPDPMASGTPAQPTTVAGETGALFYLADSGAALAAGQRVRVEVPLVGSGPQRKVVPYSSVIYDLKGDAWAYTSPAPLTYVRDRISIDFIEGDKAVLSQGPAAGATVVTIGAAELFGTEAGVGH